MMGGGLRRFKRTALRDGSKEGVPKECQAVGDEKRTCNCGCAQRDPSCQFTVFGGAKKAFQEELLGNKAEQGREAGHRNAGQDRDRGR